MVMIRKGSGWPLLRKYDQKYCSIGRNMCNFSRILYIYVWVVCMNVKRKHFVLGNLWTIMFTWNILLFYIEHVSLALCVDNNTMFSARCVRKENINRIIMYFVHMPRMWGYLFYLGLISNILMPILPKGLVRGVFHAYILLWWEN